MCVRGGALPPARLRMRICTAKQVRGSCMQWYGHIMHTVSFLAFFALILSSSEAVSGNEAVWRYVAGDSDYSYGLPSYKNQVQLECLVCLNASWESSSCQITATSNNGSSSLAEVMCSYPGYHDIVLSYTTENDSLQEETVIHVPLKNSADCYIWKAALVHHTENSTSNHKISLQIWVAELTPLRHSVEPTNKDQVLTLQYQSLGEAPSIHGINLPQDLNITAQHFNYSCSCWQVDVQIDFVWEVAVEISGKGTVVMDCGIKSTQLLLTGGTFTYLLDNSQSHTVTSSELTIAYQAEQAPAVVMIFHGGKAFISLDSLETVHPLLVDGLTSPLEAVSFTSSSLCLLSNREVFILSAENTALTQSSGLPLSGVKHVIGRGTYQMKDDNNVLGIVAAWEDGSGVVFISNDSGITFQEVVLPDLSFEGIHSVGIHPLGHKIVILVSLQNETAQFIYWSLHMETWASDAFSFNTNAGNLTVQYFPGAFGDLIVWEDSALYYSPNGGLTVHQVPMYTIATGVLVPVVFPSDEIIQQVVTGIGGQYAVLTSRNRLFYGTVRIGYAVEIPSGDLPDTRALVLFGSLGELKSVTFPNEDGVSVRNIPVYSLILNAFYPPPACPYIEWATNIDQYVYYLDIEEELTLWSSLVPRQWRPNHMSFAVSEPGLVEFSVEHSQEKTAIEGAIQRNMTVAIQAKAGIRSSPSTKAVVRLSSASQSLMCSEQAQVDAMIAVQCPPWRHLQVKRPEGYGENCEKYEDYTYTIPKEYYDPEFQGQRGVHGTIDKEVHYNYSLYGCPMQIVYSEPFRPTLELYDGNVFVREVDVDFVVWEIHGRTDYSYNATSRHAGCISPPQTWQSMLQGGGHPSQAWTKENYRPCFQEHGELQTEQSPYQILNSTGVSSILWEDHNGIYVLVATVIAKNYSFCNLTTIFAVEVYGALGNSFIGYILLLLTCLAGVAVLIASYFLYRYLLKSGKFDKTE